MEPTWEISEGLLQNDDKFRDPFFKRFALRHAAKPIQLNESVSKNYFFPTFYGDVTCAIAVFLCPYENAKKMMPHPEMKPVRMPKGRAAVLVSGYEYKNVMGVGPYNEIAMTIPVLVKPLIDLPVLPMLMDSYPGFGVHVFSMPVTSLENQLRGLKIWNLPKVVQRIDIDHHDGVCIVAAYEESGEQYFEMKVPTEGTQTHFDTGAWLYTEMDGRLARSRTSFKADFQVNKHMKALLNPGMQPQQEVFKLGDTPSGRVLQDLELEPQPLQFRYAKGMTACFDLADPGYKSPLKF